MTIRKGILALSLWGIMQVPGFFTVFSAPAGDPPLSGTKLLEQIAALHPVKRDEFIHSNINRRIGGNGTVLSVDSLKRYGMEYRVVLEERAAAKYKLNVRYYLFMTAGEKKNLKLRKNETFQFQGILSAYTPLNTGRTGYILDLVLVRDMIRAN